MKTLHFKSKGDYQKWLAYGHMRTKSGLMVNKGRTNLFKATQGNSKIIIGGRIHKVKHNK